ncbi:MAG TPA: leishmanolysin-related zinc metalloendopeptidase [Pseudonocardia sp.]|uniref:leishmanolysin-related zinc metalloendopeptidase n=1 Tax=Pseudonocardia sp. TaxID=60912 RepID=UPI002C0DA298|nr:leishmanolysin-related zinc metalloendopeptidase [Pseudonocardia sp.]HTF49550.1 leishmanolysin-related zinc metalloendopeptidase [Pseudonocardia sp.]
MARYRTYEARADARRAEALASTTSPFTIEVRFLGGLSDRQQAAFAAAADRWTKMIVGDLPTATVDNEAIDDVLILAQGSDIDGVGRVLGQAGPTHLRPESAGKAAFTPAKGIMSFDTADLANMEADGTLNDVITHEMGHVLGIGTVWKVKDLLSGEGTANPTFAGPGAIAEYQTLRAAGDRRQVPVENTGGPGTREGHWRESVFQNELMSGFIAATGNPLSRMTVASLADIGYQVDLDAAEPYQLPDLAAVAAEGELLARVASVDVAMVLPVIPQILPSDSV